MSVSSSLKGIAYENVKGPIVLNQLTAIPVDDLILFESKLLL